MRKIKNIVFTAVFSVCLLCRFSAATAEDFIDGFEDIPTMGKLYQIQKNNVSFGNDQARFVEAYLGGEHISFAEVRAFYTETLPQLGWKSVEHQDEFLRFEREEESLDIVCEQNSPLLFRITLKSKD